MDRIVYLNINFLEIFIKNQCELLIEMKYNTYKYCHKLFLI